LKTWECVDEQTAILRGRTLRLLMIVCLDAGMDDKGRKTGSVTSELAATLRGLSSTLACKDMDVVDVPKRSMGCVTCELAATLRSLTSTPTPRVWTS
jgi:hypothetical protein